MVIFLHLPGELRRMIYYWTLDLNDYVKGYKQFLDRPNITVDNTFIDRDPFCSSRRPRVARYTPTILLLNKQITSEALHVLYRIPLTLYARPNSKFTRGRMDITEFISEQLLQRIHFAVLRLDRPHKNYVLPLLDIWRHDNRLERLDVYLPKEMQITGRQGAIVKSRLGYLPGMMRDSSIH